MSIEPAAGHISLDAVRPTIGAVLLEVNDEWQMRHRYIGVEAMGGMLNQTPTNEAPQLPRKAA